jgi:type VI secretion system secreted protein Hcp
MFLKVQGVTGEAGDADLKGEIQIVSWAWGMQSPTEAHTGMASGHGTFGELEVVKLTDQASVALMSYLLTNKLIGQAKLTVRKAGTTKPVEYLTIELKNARITSLKVASEGTDLTERVRLGFQIVKVTYTGQESRGDRSASTQFEWDAEAARVG